MSEKKYFEHVGVILSKLEHQVSHGEWIPLVMNYDRGYVYNKYINLISMDKKDEFRKKYMGVITGELLTRIQGVLGEDYKVIIDMTQMSTTFRVDVEHIDYGLMYSKYISLTSMANKIESVLNGEINVKSIEVNALHNNREYYERLQQLELNFKKTLYEDIEGLSEVVKTYEEQGNIGYNDVLIIEEHKEHILREYRDFNEKRGRRNFGKVKKIGKKDWVYESNVIDSVYLDRVPKMLSNMGVIDVDSEMRVLDITNHIQKEIVGVLNGMGVGNTPYEDYFKYENHYEVIKRHNIIQVESVESSNGELDMYWKSPYDNIGKQELPELRGNYDNIDVIGGRIESNDTELVIYINDKGFLSLNRKTGKIVTKGKGMWIGTNDVDNVIARIYKIEEETQSKEKKPYAKIFGKTVWK